MSKKYELVPYKSIGEFVFGMNRYNIQQILGKPISSGRYGFPVEDRFFDDYGFFYTMFSNKNLLEAVEFFPEFTEEEITWIYGNEVIELSAGRENILNGLRKITDDLVQDEDEKENYTSKKLGVKFYNPNDDDDVASLIVHDLHCYDEEEQYLKDLENGVE